MNSGVGSGPNKRNGVGKEVVDWTVIVYPFIEGDTSLTGMTDEQWKETGAIFRRIHQVMPPPFGFESLRRETLVPTAYARWVRTFETQHSHDHPDVSPSPPALHTTYV